MIHQEDSKLLISSIILTVRNTAVDESVRIYTENSYLYINEYSRHILNFLSNKYLAGNFYIHFQTIYYTDFTVIIASRYVNII